MRVRRLAALTTTGAALHGLAWTATTRWAGWDTTTYPILGLGITLIAAVAIKATAEHAPAWHVRHISAPEPPSTTDWDGTWNRGDL